jgi:hypothetical protein
MPFEKVCIMSQHEGWECSGENLRDLAKIPALHPKKLLEISGNKELHRKDRKAVCSNCLLRVQSLCPDQPTAGCPDQPTPDPSHLPVIVDDDLPTSRQTAAGTSPCDQATQTEPVVIVSQMDDYAGQMTISPDISDDNLAKLAYCLGKMMSEAVVNNSLKLQEELGGMINRSTNYNQQCDLKPLETIIRDCKQSVSVSVFDLTFAGNQAIAGF